MFVSHRKRSNRFIIMIIQRVGLRFLLLLRSKSFIANTFERFSYTYCLAASKWFCIVYSNHWSIKSFEDLDIEEFGNILSYFEHALLKNILSMYYK